MTKIATQVPQTLCRPVYVSDSVYEVWYSKPVSLGCIHYKGDYWYTSDGQRFVSSRDAMSYMLRTGKMELPVNLQSKAHAMPIPERPAPAPKQPTQRVQGRTLETSVANAPAPENQNHPKFQEFLDFQEFLARRKAQKLVDTSEH